MAPTADRIVLPDEYEKPKRWWQNPQWVKAVAFLIFAVGNTTWALTTVATQNDVQDAEAAFDDLAALTDGNRATLDRLADNQAGIDVLVSFVREVQAQQEAAEGGSGDAVQTLITILCASSDPVRIEACQALQSEP